MTLSHDLAGDGPPVVLLHAGAADRRMWEPQWRPLAEAGYRLVRPDFRGYGDTPTTDRPHSDAADVLDLLDTLDLARVTLIASSYGGQVAFEVSARWPERVHAVVSLCSALADHEPSAALRAFAEQEAALLGTGDLTAATELNVDTWLGPEADENASDAVRRMQHHAFEVQLAAEEFEPTQVEFDLASIHAPALVVSGGRDLPDFTTVADRLCGSLPKAQRLDLPWAGHLPNLERPPAVTDLLVGFLRDNY